jgi:hypothetical protein
VKRAEIAEFLRKKWPYIIVIVVLAYFPWYVWRAGFLLQPEGTILIATVLPSGKGHGIVSLSWEHRNNTGFFSNQAVEAVPVFVDNQYSSLFLSQKKGDTFICSVSKDHGKSYAVVRIQNDESVELMTSKTEIRHPRLLDNDRQLVYTTVMKEETLKIPKGTGYFYIHDLKSGQTRKIIDVPIFSKPAAATDGTFLVAAYSKDKAATDAGLFSSLVIKQISLDGQSKDLVMGYSPVWFEESKSFFFLSADEYVNLYDIPSATIKRIAKIVWASNLVLSPDKKYLLLNEGVWRWYDGYYTSRLVVLSLDGWVKKELRTPAYSMITSRGHLWLP